MSRKTLPNVKQLFLGFLLLLAGWRLTAQEGSGGRLYQTDTVRIQQAVQFVGVPIVFYTPETQFGFGGGAQIFFPRQSNIYNARKSNIFLDAMYTTRNQFIMDIKPQLFFLKGDLYLEAPFQFKIFPNFFWGLGNRAAESAREQYNMRTVSLAASLLQRLAPSINFGLKFWYEDHRMLDILENGILESEQVEGWDGARLGGLGLVINLDDRDVVESPRRGAFVQFSGEFSSQAFGASHSFNKFVLDFRKYFSVAEDQVLAMQFFSEANFGTVPFQRKAWLGGGEKLRGYFRGRYMDDHMFVLQAEYRWRFLPRWVLAGFVGAGEVAAQPNEYFDVIKLSGGGGLRFQIVKKLPTLVRLDIGFGQEGNMGVYFGVNEAF